MSDQQHVLRCSLLSPSRCKDRADSTPSLNLKDKHQHLQSKNITFAPRGEERSEQKTSPRVPLRFQGWGTVSGCVLLRKPQRCHRCHCLWLRAGLEMQDQLCGLLFRRCKRHRHFPAEHRSVCDALQVPPPRFPTVKPPVGLLSSPHGPRSPAAPVCWISHGRSPQESSKTCNTLF